MVKISTYKGCRADQQSIEFKNTSLKYYKMVLTMKLRYTNNMHSCMNKFSHYQCNLITYRQHMYIYKHTNTNNRMNWTTNPVIVTRHAVENI